jgi:hypothetical protein
MTSCKSTRYDANIHASTSSSDSPEEGAALTMASRIGKMKGAAKLWQGSKYSVQGKEISQFMPGYFKLST